MNDRIKELLKLIRIHNAFIALLVVFVGVKAASGGYVPFIKTLVLGFSMFFLDIFANVHNDIVDVENDMKNKKNRPLVAGTVKESEAKKIAFVSLFFSLLFSLIDGMRIFLLVLFLAILVYLYNTSLKRYVLLSNLTVSFILGMVFIISGVLVNSIKYAIPPALIAFYYNLIREIIKDWADIEGDKQSGITSIPMVLGPALTNALLIILSVFFIPFLFIPFIGNIYGRWYLYLSVAFCATPLLAAILILKRTKEDLLLLSKITKILMIPLLLAIYSGG